MHWLDLPRVETKEEIDDPSQPFDGLATSMANVARSNRLFGGTSAVVGHVAAILRGASKASPVRILDIGTGSADIPHALINWGKRHRRKVTVVAVDNLWNMLRMAAEGRESSDLQLVQADALSLPFPPGSFDIAVCALVFHHVGFDAAARLLGAMDSLTTQGLVVTDLKRDRLSHIGVRAALSLMGADGITRNDGSISVLRSFTLQEYRKMAALSGVTGLHVKTHWYYRVAIVKDKNS